ncbi:DUF1616 domain-containing protein [Thermococcus bergensis]|uniref:DUF1616 domain-containing protein n=1 Tax=Thermococcus bergensis TaxID=2689387 RepID=UPI001CECED2E|nr:DUF1616 domain-containing protein [Thermococcus bergensis]MCA6213559.1 DUF1616 domain-containing protein [Thermococcus bergensis]
MSWKDYWDLITIIVLSLVLDVIIAFYPESLLRKALGLAFVLFFPGYVFITALFPEKKELDNIERLALSFGLSIAIVPLIGLLLNYTPWGIRLIPILVSLTIFNVIFALVAIYRRANAINPWIPRISIEKIKEELEWEQSSRLDKALTVILVIAIITSIGTLAYVVTHPRAGEKFTEFYILGPEGKADDYPTELFVGENGTVILGIANHEYQNVTYHVEIWLVNLTYDFETNRTIIHNMYLMDYFNVTLPHKPVSLEGNWTPQWEMNYTFNIDKPGKWQLWFLLFKDERPPLPEPINGDYAQTSATQRILDAIEGKIQSLKLNIEVREI